MEKSEYEILLKDEPISMEDLNKITSTKNYENLDAMVGEDTAKLIYRAIDALKIIVKNIKS